MKLTDESHPDYKDGIRKIAVSVGRCAACGRDTNTFRINPNRIDDRLILACSKECAARC